MKPTSLSKHWLFIIIFWIILGVTLWAQMIRDYPFFTATAQAIAVIIGSAVVSHTLSDYLLPKALATGKMRLFVLQCLLMTLLLALILSGIAVIGYWHSIYGTMRDSQEKMESYGVWWVRFFSDIPSAILICGTTCGIRFYQEHSLIEKNHALLQQAHLEAQLRLLQDQTNPHLMFNVLNHIHILMRKDTELASLLLIKFSDVLRYQLYECNRTSVLLEREVQYLKDLVAVEKIRWGDELIVDCIWNIADGKKEVVPLLLIPFVENAFKHVARLPKEKGYVNLKLNQRDNKLIFTIENSNSPEQPRKNKSHGLGLQNVQKRLNILYPDTHELAIKKTDKIFAVALTIELG